MDELESTWNFIYNYSKEQTKNDCWENTLETISTVKNIPQVMYCLDKIPQCDEWPATSDLHFFRQGIRPMWEDPANIDGGKWVLEFSKTEPNELCLIWRSTIAFCVGESSGEKYSKSITGCVFSPRKYVDRISLWVSKKDNSVLDIGRLWRDMAGFKNKGKAIFRLHSNALSGNKGGRESSIYTLQ